MRFHPRGELVQGSLVKAVRAHENSPGVLIVHRSLPVDIAVPDDATPVEMWFHHGSQTSMRCDACPRRFGANDWFGMGGPPLRHSTPPVCPHTVTCARSTAPLAEARSVPPRPNTRGSAARASSCLTADPSCCRSTGSVCLYSASTRAVRTRIICRRTQSGCWLGIPATPSAFPAWSTASADAPCPGAAGRRGCWRRNCCKPSGPRRCWTTPRHSLTQQLMHWECRSGLGLGEHQVSGDRDRRENAPGIAVLPYLFMLRMCHHAIVPSKSWHLFQLQHALRLRVMTSRAEHAAYGSTASTLRTTRRAKLWHPVKRPN